MKRLIDLLEHVLAGPLEGWQNGALECFTISDLNRALQCSGCSTTYCIDHTLFTKPQKAIVRITLSICL